MRHERRRCTYHKVHEPKVVREDQPGLHEERDEQHVHGVLAGAAFLGRAHDPRVADVSHGREEHIANDGPPRDTGRAPDEAVDKVDQLQPQVSAHYQPHTRTSSYVH
jgi:hypothetical protein